MRWVRTKVATIDERSFRPDHFPSESRDTRPHASGFGVLAVIKPHEQLLYITKFSAQSRAWEFW
jgi:hypothetical protein